MVGRRKGDHGQQAGRHYWHHHSQLTKSGYAVLMYTTDLHPKPQGSDRASPQLHWGQLPPARGNATSVTESASPKPRGWEKADGAAQGQSAGCAGGRKGHNWSYPSVVGRWSGSVSSTELFAFKYAAFTMMFEHLDCSDWIISSSVSSSLQVKQTVKH